MQPGTVGRRSLLGAGAGIAAQAHLGFPATAAQAGQSNAGPRHLSIAEEVLPPGPPVRPADFGIVGVFDVDWLLEPRFTRLLDNFAASPGAFRAVRFFGALNSGEREDTFPTRSGGVWLRREAKPDFSTTLQALAALVSRGLVPFVGLTFFPAAVSPSPIVPPSSFEAWTELVRGFLDAVVARFGADEVARWWFEAWNEPNIPPFWGGSFDQYLDLYRATSDAVVQSGHAVRLGGPVLAYMPGEGPALMQRFLGVLAQDPALRCDFVSYHRKGIWGPGEDEPRLARLAEAAEDVAQAVLRLIPERAHGLWIVNDEADMKVGFDKPFEPRLTEQFPAWLAASLVVHEGLSAKYAVHGMRFLAAADDANQQLVQAPFDGRRSVMTRASAAVPGDLLKLPAYAFYELLPLLGERYGGALSAPDDAFFPHTDLLHLATVAEDHIGVLFTCCPDRGGGAGWRLDYALRDVPWPRVNAAWFRIDGTHSNAYTAAGRRMPAAPASPDAVRRIRAAQELSVAAPIRSGLELPDRVFRDHLDLAP
ncbi:MAG: hypothetical protein JO157_06660, partial [Acetobacteraceae bacterium]|nr:hypothetical protein [Acetobacteraceae bacterium]